LAPTGRKGFYEWHGDISKTISNSARSSTTATLTTSTAHGLRVGDEITVAGTNGNSALHGTYTITAVPTTTTLTYTTTTSGTITSAADTGTVVCLANSWTVTDFLSQGSTTEYNTPGNADYNADEAIDFIIASTEDPTS
jgi:hypothetical protein